MSGGDVLIVAVSRTVFEELFFFNHSFKMSSPTATFFPPLHLFSLND